MRRPSKRNVTAVHDYLDRIVPGVILCVSYDYHDKWLTIELKRGTSRRMKIMAFSTADAENKLRSVFANENY